MQIALLLSTSWQLQLLFEYRLHIGSSAIEWTGIDIRHLKNRVFSEELASLFGDTKFGEEYQEDLEWYRGLGR
jgi:hypothetical protein